jgi:hypothetical protein
MSNTILMHFLDTCNKLAEEIARPSFITSDNVRLFDCQIVKKASSLGHLHSEISVLEVFPVILDLLDNVFMITDAAQNRVFIIKLLYVVNVSRCLHDVVVAQVLNVASGGHSTVIVGFNYHKDVTMTIDKSLDLVELQKFCHRLLRVISCSHHHAVFSFFHSLLVS